LKKNNIVCWNYKIMAQKQIEVQRKIEEGNKETSVWLKADLEKQLTKARKKRMADEMCEKELVAKMERLEKHQSMWKSIIPAKGMIIK
jgi:hypothetical protein